MLQRGQVLPQQQRRVRRGADVTLGGTSCASSREHGREGLGGHDLGLDAELREQQRLQPRHQVQVEQRAAPGSRPAGRACCGWGRSSSGRRRRRRSARRGTTGRRRAPARPGWTPRRASISSSPRPHSSRRYRSHIGTSSVRGDQPPGWNGRSPRSRTARGRSGPAAARSPAWRPAAGVVSGFAALLLTSSSGGRRRRKCPASSAAASVAAP